MADEQGPGAGTREMNRYGKPAVQVPTQGQAVEIQEEQSGSPREYVGLMSGCTSRESALSVRAVERAGLDDRDLLEPLPGPRSPGPLPSDGARGGKGGRSQCCVAIQPFVYSPTRLHRQVKSKRLYTIFMDAVRYGPESYETSSSVRKVVSAPRADICHFRLRRRTTRCCRRRSSRASSSGTRRCWSPS